MNLFYNFHDFALLQYLEIQMRKLIKFCRTLYACDGLTVELMRHKKKSM